MKGFLIAVILMVPIVASAAAPPRGPDRLRDLVVFPQMDLHFNFGLDFQGNQSVSHDNSDTSDQISRARATIKQQPDNVRCLLHLGNLLDNEGETNESRSCYQEAEKLCRGKLTINPQDGLIMLDLGEALHEQEEDMAAENAYRQAVSVLPREWRCWAGLGNFLGNNFFLSIFPAPMRGQIFSSQPPPPSVLDYRPPAAALEQAEARCHEAAGCFERAMALAPQEPQVFFQHAGFLCQSNFQDCFFRHYRGLGRISPADWLTAFFPAAAIDDLQAASKISPKDSQYISLAAYFAWIRATQQADVANPTFGVLAGTGRPVIRDAMTELENLENDPDKTNAAAALENLGALNMVSGNTPEAVTDLRRAISLDPAREQLWDMLLIALVTSASPAEVTALCELRLKHRNSARNHLFLARAFDHESKWRESAGQAEAALQIELKNPAIMITAHSELAALALKQSSDPDFRPKVAAEFTQIEGLLPQNPRNVADWSRWRDLNLNLAIYDGLGNTPEGMANAKACVNNVLQYFPNDNLAKQILDALN